MTVNTKSLKTQAESGADGIKKATYYKVAPGTLEFEPGFNLREESAELNEHLEKMYQAMKEGAVFPPIDISVVDGKRIVRDGHCRTRVANRLVAEGIDYVLEARELRGNEAECVLHMLGSSQGKALTPLEAGRGYMRLVRYGMTVADISRRTGLSRTTIDTGITLAEAPVAMQKMIASGEVSVQVALDSLHKHGNRATDVVAEAVVKAKAAGTGKVTKKHVAQPKVRKIEIPSVTWMADVIETADGYNVLEPEDLAQRIIDAMVLLTQ